MRFALGPLVLLTMAAVGCAPLARTTATTATTAATTAATTTATTAATTMTSTMTSTMTVTTTTTTTGLDGRRCEVFLVKRPGLMAPGPKSGLPLVLEMGGTGEYHQGGGAKGNPMLAPLVDSGRAALLTFNKPGVTTDGGAPRGFTIEDATYNNYTVDDLVACAVGALTWASTTENADSAAPIVIHGHSEGAIVATRALLELQRQRSALVPHISAVLLSGTPAGSMAEIVKAQAAGDGGWPAYQHALDIRDDAFFRTHSGIGAATMKAMLALPPLTMTFAELAKTGFRSRIALFHGRHDDAVPVAMVERLEHENSERRRRGEDSLELSLREYLGGHHLDLSALHDMALWLADALDPEGYLQSAPREMTTTTTTESK